MNTDWIRLGITRTRRAVTKRWPACRAGAKRRRVLAMTVAIVIGGSSSVFACPVCFGAEETSAVEGMRLGVFALLAVTLAVQCGFAGFFLYLRRRAKRIADLDLDTEWSNLQTGASRS